MARLTPHTPASDPQTSVWPRRLFMGLGGLIALFLVVIIGLRLFIQTPTAARLIENQINSRSFGPIKQVEISGLSGDPLSDITIEHVAVFDRNGKWLSADNIVMSWSPWGLLKRKINIESLEIDRLDILQRPELETNKASSGKDPYSLKIGTYDVPLLHVDTPVLGQVADFKVSGQTALSKNLAGQVSANVERLDQAGDSLHLDFRRETSGVMTGTFNLRGIEDGPVAILLNAPKGAAVTGTCDVSGTPQSGHAEIVLAFNAVPAVNGTLDWAAETGNARLSVLPQDWPLFAPLRQTLTDTLDISAQVDRLTPERPFNLSANAGTFMAEASGEWGEWRTLPTSAQMALTAENAGALLPLPKHYSLGTARVDGTIEKTDAVLFSGTVTLNDIMSPDIAVARLSGPIDIRRDTDNLLTYTTDVTLENLRAKRDVPVRFGRDGRVKSTGTFDVTQRQLTLAPSTFTTGQNTVRTQGQFNTKSKAYALSGSAQLALNRIGDLPPTGLQTTYKVNARAGARPSINVNGAIRPDGESASPYDTLLGQQLNFKGNVVSAKNGFKITNVQLQSDAFRAVLDGDISDDVNLTGEAMLTSEVSYKNVSLGDDTSANFQIIGARDNPNIRIDARTNQFNTGSYIFDDARVRADLQTVTQTPRGPLQINAQTPQGEFILTTQFTSNRSDYQADDIQLSWGRLNASGDMAVDKNSRLADGRMTLDLPEAEGQYAKATVNFAPLGDTQGVNILADAQKINVRGVNIDALHAELSGTLDTLSGDVTLSGQWGDNDLTRKLELEIPVQLGRDESGRFTAVSSPKGQYGNIPLTSDRPITLTYDEGTLNVDAPLQIAASPVALIYERGETGEALKFTADNMPVKVLPLPIALIDTRGRINVNVDISTQTGQAMGHLQAQIVDWRGADIAKGEGLNVTYDTVLDGNQSEWSLNGQSKSGFKMVGDGSFALTPASTLAAIRMDMQAPLRGTFMASGAAESVLGLITPSDANLDGDLAANLTLSGTAADPRIEGQSSATDIRFEAPTLGTQIRAGRYTANFSNDQIDVSDFHVADKDGGTLSGNGRFRLGEFARPLGELNLQSNDFQLLDRRDLNGQVTGEITFSSTKEKLKLSGDVQIMRAEVKEFISGSQSVIEIEVEEINKPAALEPIEIKVPRTPIELDMSIKAPRRIFIRSRGLDVEMALDAQVKGTFAAPELHGEATVLRGGFKIAGKELAFQTGGITFNGDIPKARVNLIAETETQNLSVQVKVTGTVENPEVVLSSSPDRPQDEILSALLFGRSATELSTLEAAQLAGAIAQFSGGGGFDLLGGVRNALGVGQLSIGVGEDGGALITGGRYLARNVYLQVFSGAGANQTGAVIDWEIRKNISLRSRLQADNNQSFSFKWKRDF